MLDYLVYSYFLFYNSSAEGVLNMLGNCEEKDVMTINVKNKRFIVALNEDGLKNVDYINCLNCVNCLIKISIDKVLVVNYEHGFI